MHQLFSSKEISIKESGFHYSDGIFGRDSSIMLTPHPYARTFSEP